MTETSPVLPIISPREAVLRTDQNFYTAMYWRSFPIVVNIRKFVQEETAGQLRSLRFTALRPQKRGADRETFLYDRLIPILDAGSYITNAPGQSLQIELCDSCNSLFALVQYENGVTSEIELNEALPDSVPDTAFVKANFTHGHLTNQPLTGYFNAEGSVLVDSAGCHRFIVEGDHFISDTPFAWMQHCFEKAVARGEVAPGKLECETWINLIKEALK